MKEVLEKKIAAMIEQRASKVKGVFDRIQYDGDNLTDYVVGASSVKFGRLGIDENGPKMAGAGRLTGVGMMLGNVLLGLHDNAVTQIAGKTGVPSAYLKRLVGGADWERNLAIDIMNEHHLYEKRDRVLVRAVSDTVRGYLSSRYKRLDSYQIYGSFIEGTKSSDGVLIDGFAGEVKSYLESINPRIIDVETENNGTVYMVFGAQLRNSDFGAASLDLRFITIQPICWNGATRYNVLKSIHLGGELPTDIELSKETHDTDTKAKALIVRDAMKQLFSAKSIEREVAIIKKASSTEIQIEEEIKKLPKTHITDTEKDDLTSKMFAAKPSDGIIGRPSLWSFAQGVGAVARDVKDEERRRDLAELSGSILNRVTV